jgi:transcriptional regulator GlxA family with amidase domain
MRAVSVNARRNSNRQTQPLRVGFVLANNFTLSALSNFVDVLRLAADENDNSRPIHCRWHIMSHSQQAIRSSSNLAVQPTSQLLAADELDYVVVVGGLLQRGPQIDSKTRDYLIEMGTSDVNLVGICTGSFILWRLGLLKSRKCCISWYHYRDFLEEFGDTTPVADQLYVVDGSRITCSGGGNVAHLAAFLVDRHVGSSSAQKALRILQIDRVRPADAAQSAPLTDLRSEDDRISQSLLIMEQNLISPVPVARIASIVHTSPRQLERLFKEIVGCSPQTAYIHMRLRHAKWMLKSELSLAAIAAETGFTDSSHLSKAYKSVYGVSPSEDRERQAHDQGRSVQTDVARRVFDLV